MKNLFLVIWIALSGCSVLDKNALSAILKNNSFNWHISTPDTSLLRQIHFREDSLYVLVFKDAQDTSYSNVGFWHTRGRLIQTSLRLSSRIDDGEIRLKSYRNGILKFSSYKDNRSKTVKRNYHFKAVKINEGNGPDPTQYLVGSWYDPADSVLATISEWKQSGKILVNPKFRFTKDSFDIRTEDYREKGIYQMINCGHQVILLKSPRYYNHNLTHMTIMVDYIDSTRIQLRLDKKYRLKRNGT